MISRSVVARVARSVIVQLLDLERSVGELDEALHASLRLGERAGGLAQALYALLEQCQRRSEVELLGLQRLGDLLEAGQAVFDRHGAGSAGVGRMVVADASISPSR